MQLGNHPVLERVKNSLGDTAPEVGTKAYTIVNKIDNYPVAELLSKNQAIFQREIKPGRVKNIVAKMVLYGYDHANPVVIGEDGKLIDGQHRTLAADSLNITEIPAIIAKFRSPQAKAEYFVMKSRPEGGSMATIDRLRAELSSGNLYAKYIYKLGRDDATCVFHDRVAFKGVTNPKTKISAVAFLKIFNWVGVEFRRRWEQQSAHLVEQKIRESSYQDIKNRMNRFGTWFFAWAPTSNNLVYRDKILVGVLDFYMMMLRQPGGNVAAIERASIRKLQTYDFRNCLTLDMSSIPGALISFYNGKKKANRMIEISLAL